MERIITRAYLKNLSKLSKISGIYKITSPSGKVYIGQSIDLQKRLNDYQKYNKTGAQIRLKASFDKYGVENHIFEIIEECPIEMLNQKERYWQEFYSVLEENGLNCKYTSTTDKSGKLSEQTKNKISNSLIGKKRTEEQKQKMSNSQKGKKQSKETVEKRASKIREYMKSKDYKDKFRNNEQIVYQYSKDLKFIIEWKSVREASRQLNIDCSLIVKSMSDKYPNKTGKGFIWSYTKKHV